MAVGSVFQWANGEAREEAGSAVPLDSSEGAVALRAEAAGASGACSTGNEGAAGAAWTARAGGAAWGGATVCAAGA